MSLAEGENLMSDNSRRSRFVDSKVQGALVKRFVLHWIAFLLTSFVLLVLWQLLVSGDPIHGFGSVLDEIWTHNMPVFVTLIVLLPVLVFDTIKLSHRFAGPVIRLREALRDVADGVPGGRLQFRENDFWRDLPDIFNRAIDRMRADTARQDESRSNMEAGV